MLLQVAARYVARSVYYAPQAYHWRVTQNPTPVIPKSVPHRLALFFKPREVLPFSEHVRNMCRASQPPSSRERIYRGSDLVVILAANENAAEPKPVPTFT